LTSDKFEGFYIKGYLIELEFNDYYYYSINFYFNDYYYYYYYYFV